VKGSIFCSFARSVAASCHSLVIVFGGSPAVKKSHVRKKNRFEQPS
jgi:hypothetical protein